MILYNKVVGKSTLLMFIKLVFFFVFLPAFLIVSTERDRRCVRYRGRTCNKGFQWWMSLFSVLNISLPAHPLKHVADMLFHGAAISQSIWTYAQEHGRFKSNMDTWIQSTGGKFNPSASPKCPWARHLTTFSTLSTLIACVKIVC